MEKRMITGKSMSEGKKTPGMKERLDGRSWRRCLLEEPYAAMNKAETCQALRKKLGSSAARCPILMCRRKAFDT
jgi:hypothetical protein